MRVLHVASTLVRSSAGIAAALGFFAMALPTAADAQLAGPGFGSSTVVVGDLVAVGEANSIRRPGAVYLYRASADGWIEAGRITAADGTAGDRFGESLAASGNTLVVGATNGDGGRGAAYVIELDGDAWRQSAKLSVPDLEPGAALGSSVAVRDGLALVATDDGSVLSWVGVIEGLLGPAELEMDAPAVYAFRLGGDGAEEWRSAGMLSPAEAEGGIGFGHAMAIAGDGTVYVGVERRDGSIGGVLAYRDDGDAWTAAGEIAGRAGSGFGASLAPAGDDVLVIGAPLLDGQQGQAFVYERDAAGDWQETAQLRPEAGATGNFGAAVAVAEDGEAVLVAGNGAAFASSLDPAAGTWSEALRLDVAEGNGTSFFSTSVAARGAVGVVGFAEDDFGAGSATIVRAGGDGWEAESRVVGELDRIAAVTGDEVRCTEGVAAEFECDSVDLVSFVPVSDLGTARGVQVTDIWGWSDPQTGSEYALVGRSDGTAFVDVSDPGNPIYVGELPKTEGSQAAGWRDVKTYRNYALVVADGAGAHGMQVFDLTRLRDVGGADMPVTFEPDVTYDGFGSSHNVIVNESSDFAYAVTGECGGGLHMVDMSDPLKPAGAGCYTHSGNSPLDSFTHDSQCVAYTGPDAEYQGREVCFTSGFMGLLISDMSDRENPTTVGLGQLPDQALPHQGWLTEDQRYFLLGDEGDELQGVVDHTRTLIWDVTDLDDPVLMAEYFGPTKAVDHNMYVRGNLVYQANYDAGLRVIDISDISAPREVGYFDTVPQLDDQPRFRMGAWSVYPYFESGLVVVSSGGEGLFVLRYRPQEPVS